MMLEISCKIVSYFEQYSSKVSMPDNLHAVWYCMSMSMVWYCIVVLYRAGIPGGWGRLRRNKYLQRNMDSAGRLRIGEDGKYSTTSALQYSNQIHTNIFLML